MDRAKILLVEDDKNSGYLLSENLKSEGYAVTVCENGELGWEAFVHEPFDLCILDIMLPKKDGMELATNIKNRNPEIPFIFLSARTMSEDKIKGFKIGCDDYVTKPFHMEEMLLRVKAVLQRRSRDDIQEVKSFELGAYQFNVDERKIVGNNKKIKLSNKESLLIKLFCENMNQVVSRNKILLTIWGRDDYYTSNSLDVYLTKIRKILKESECMDLQNIHGYGYKLVQNP